MVVAVGWGTRLRPFTYTLPKHLLPAAGEPLICHALKMIAGVELREVGIVVSPTVELFRQALEKETDLRITYILQPEPKGLDHAVTCAEGFVDEEDFLVVLGDNLLGEGLGSVLSRFRAGSAHIVALSEVEDPRQFGVAVVEGGRSGVRPWPVDPGARIFPSSCRPPGAGSAQKPTEEQHGLYPGNRGPPRGVLKEAFKAKGGCHAPQVL